MAGPGLPSFHGIIGRSAAMRALFRRIELVAPDDVPVLIHGESGTGKELVATAIHLLSRRSGRPFEKLNGGALPRELLLAELFGHERGAFTGATERRVGLVARAHTGTLLLDEVGDLLPEAQVALLRFLQEGEIRPVGSDRVVRVDVRLVSATHRDLARAVEREEFREDLYYRLFDLDLRVPPLRDRREDIPLLLEHFWRSYAAARQLPIAGVSPSALRMLQGHGWPGNVRQLEKAARRAVILRRQGWLQPEDFELPVAALEHRPPLDAQDESPGGALDLTWPQREALRIARDRGEVQRGDLMERCPISTETARRALVSLVQLGFLRRVGGGRGVRYVAPRAGEPARAE